MNGVGNWNEHEEESRSWNSNEKVRHSSSKSRVRVVRHRANKWLQEKSNPIIHRHDESNDGKGEFMVFLEKNGHKSIIMYPEDARGHET